MTSTLTRPTFGDHLRERREHQGLSQRELARRLGIKHPSVGYWESDKHLPRGEHFVPLAKVLGLRTSTLGRWLEDSPLARLPEDTPGYLSWGQHRIAHLLGCIMPSAAVA